MGALIRTRRWRPASAVALMLAMVAAACAPTGGGGGGGFGPPEGHPTTSTIPWQDPAGLWTYLDMTCYANVFNNYINFPQPAQVNADAPTSVQQGEQFDVWLTPGTFVPPQVIQGYTVNSVTRMVIRFPLPENSTFVDAVLTSGTNIGEGYPAVWEAGGEIISYVPGPFVPGSIVQLPGVRLTLEATGPVGSTIRTSMSQLSTLAYFDAAVVGSTCLPDFDYIFSNTTIN